MPYYIIAAYKDENTDSVFHSYRVSKLISAFICFMLSLWWDGDYTIVKEENITGFLERR